MASGMIHVPIPEACLRRAFGNVAIGNAYAMAHAEGEDDPRAIEVYVGAYLTRRIMNRLEGLPDDARQ